MGFKKIYLLGCDCDYQINESPDEMRSHFYSESAEGQALTRSLGSMSHAERIEWQELILSNYEIVKHALESQGCTIYNAGIGGKLDVFDRVVLEDILSQPRLKRRT
jgi:ubiquitin C-terminal hydrolase